MTSTDVARSLRYMKEEDASRALGSFPKGMCVILSYGEGLAK